jgi:hypothetical protein
MNKRELRCPSLFILGFALLLILPVLAAADEHPAASPAARALAEFAAVAPPQAASCVVCAAAYQKCSTVCFGRADKSGLGACLNACDNAAALCSCDQVVNLRSEDLVDFEWPSAAKAACHGSVSCQPNYPSCASWSSYSNCGDPYCGFFPHCGECICDEFRCFCGPGPAIDQDQERFRVCFDQYGNSCTEWQKVKTLVYCEC